MTLESINQKFHQPITQVSTRVDRSFWGFFAEYRQTQLHLGRKWYIRSLLPTLIFPELMLCVSVLWRTRFGCGLGGGLVGCVAASIIRDLGFKPHQWHLWTFLDHRWENKSGYGLSFIWTRSGLGKKLALPGSVLAKIGKYPNLI